MTQPNLVIITCHDLGDFIHPYGVPVTTPHFDRLAAEGIVFENHFSTGTVCSPSRGSIVTGCYPHTHGLMGLTHRGWELDMANSPPLPKLLTEAGYSPQLFGFQHEAMDWRTLGYENNHSDSCLCEKVADSFCEWLNTRKDDGPFFASLGFFETHRLDLQPSHFRRDAYESVPGDQVEVPAWLPDIETIRQDLADFYGMIQFVDAQIGRIFEALERKGIAEDTLVVFTTDHGASFIHGKATLYDGGTKVACLMRYPNVIPGGTRLAGLTSHVDLLPTIFDLLQLPASAIVQGRNVAGAVRGEGDTGREYVFAERNYTTSFDPARMARSGRYKYIRKGLQTCVFDFLIPEVELSTWDWRRTREVRAFYDSTRTTEELYDLQADPGELSNLAMDKAHTDVLDHMRRALDDHLRDTDDPFQNLQIPILMPENLMRQCIERRK
ncbi:sulfatase [bacterium]|nr:sulfatase [bacterium]